MMLCDPNFLSVGGGDGHYGLWLDDTMERGISSSCPTFGNEPLSEEGEKFEGKGHGWRGILSLHFATATGAECETTQASYCLRGMKRSDAELMQ